MRNKLSRIGEAAQTKQEVKDNSSSLEEVKKPGWKAGTTASTPLSNAAQK